MGMAAASNALISRVNAVTSFRAMRELSGLNAGIDTVVSVSGFTATAADDVHNDGPHDEASIQHPAGDVLKTGDAYKAEIAQRKAALSDLKMQIDKLNGSIHFVEANAYRNGVQYNKRQAQKQQDVERLKSQYEEQKRDLEQMQENARKAGFGSAVWDP